MSDERICQGYRVIDSIRVGDTEIVLAHNPKAPQPYVTWKSYAFTKFQEFAYGRYFSQEAPARKNMRKRVNELREELPFGHPDKTPPDDRNEHSPHDHSDEKPQKHLQPDQFSQKPLHKKKSHGRGR